MDSLCRTYLYVVVNKKEQYNDVYKYLKKITSNLLLTEHGFMLGYNEKIDIDINVMIRKTIKEFIDKEDIFVALKKNYNLDIYLEIVPYLSEKYKPILSLEKDIISFIYKSEIELDLDYYLI